MDKARSNLKHPEATRDGEFFYPMHDFVLDRYVRRDMYIGISPSIQEIVGQPGALSQDCFRALIVSQGGCVESLEPLSSHTRQVRE